MVIFASSSISTENITRSHREFDDNMSFWTIEWHQQECRREDYEFDTLNLARPVSLLDVIIKEMKGRM